AVNDAYAMSNGTPLTIVAPGPRVNDLPLTGTTATFPASPLPSGATLTGTSPAGAFTYTPPTAATLPFTDTFQYTIGIGGCSSTPATVTITVRALDAAPVANPDTYTTPFGKTLTTTAAQGVLQSSNGPGKDTDADGDTLTASLVTGPTNGTLVLN